MVVHFAQPRRYNVDKWDERMIARDLRLTGKPRHQKVRSEYVTIVSKLCLNSHCRHYEQPSHTYTRIYIIINVMNITCLIEKEQLAFVVS